MKTYEVTYPNGRTFTYAELTESQKEFLDRYEPADDMFTSNEEVAQVITELSLGEIHDVEVMRAVRNSVVSHYSDLMESQMQHPNMVCFDMNDDEEEHVRIPVHDYMTSMQSVTAVIDHCMYNINKMAV